MEFRGMIIESADGRDDSFERDEFSSVVILFFSYTCI